MHPISIKHAKAKLKKTDGFRILIENTWPSGLPENAIDLWLKDLAPSKKLNPLLWDEFRKKYTKELKKHTKLIHRILQELNEHPVVLVYEQGSMEFNAGIVICIQAQYEYLKQFY